ncbi:hypothetical protein ANN_07213, partial [Periplaneta americana]
MVTYTTEQRVFIVETYLLKKSYERCLRKFCIRFPEAARPSKPYVFDLFKKWRETGSVLNKKRHYAKRAPTEERPDMRARIELSPSKSSRSLAQECGISQREVRRRFLTEFPEVRLPSREAVRKLVNKLRETGSILDKKRRVKRRVLTEEKVGEVGERLEHSPQKSLLRIAQETAISMTSAWRATKLLKLKPHMRIKKKEKRNGPANKRKGAAENDTSTEIGKEVDENETEFVADQAQ